MTVPLSLTCLGPPAIRLSGGDPPPDVLWRKHVALLAYLALSPGHARTREHLVGLLWPDKTQEQARHSLSEALRRLRVSLGAGRLDARGDQVVLSSDGLEVDAVRFEQADGHGEALALYRGDFLEGFAVGDADAFDDWAGGVRRRLRARALDLLLRAGEEALARGAQQRATDLALRAAAMDSLGAAPVHLLMRARALSGDAGAALAAWHDYSRRLEAELGEAPAPELSALAARLRQENLVTKAAPAAPEPAFIGSAAAAQVFGESTDALRGAGSRAVMVMAAPGFGRSRLLEEAGRRARLAGATVIQARPLMGDQDVAWSTLRQLVAGGLAAARGVMAADADAVGMAAHFAPALADRIAPVAPRDRAHAAGALAALLCAAADEAPVLVLLDDAELADGVSLAALHGALRACGPARIAVVLAVAAEADLPMELLDLSADIGGAIPGSFVRLAPLEIADLHELVSTLVPGEKAEDIDRLARRLAMETGGSPFWAVTLLRSLAQSQPVRRELLTWPPRSRTYDAPLPAGVPGLARLAAAARLASLSPRARALVVAAAVARTTDPGLLANITDGSRADVEADLAELERAHLVVFVEGRHRFAAPLLETLVRSACVTSGERERIRGRVIAALDERAGDVECVVLAAELAAERGTDSAAARRAIDAARLAIGRGLTRGAMRALRAADAACPGEDAERLAEIAAVRSALS